MHDIVGICGGKQNPSFDGGVFTHVMLRGVFTLVGGCSALVEP